MLEQINNTIDKYETLKKENHDLMQSCDNISKCNQYSVLEILYNKIIIDLKNLKTHAIKL